MENKWEIKDIIKMSKIELEKALKEASEKYYNEEEPIITDEVFDFMKERLEKMDPTSKFLKDIGTIPKDKIKLPYFMGSLEKITKKHSDKIIDWINKYKGSYVLSDKLDGVSCMIYKKDGKIKLYSKGTREFGRDITELIDIMKHIGLNNINEDIVVRGELIISKKDFKKIKDEKNLKNARNTVAGLVNSKTKDKDIEKITQFVAYSVYKPQLKKIDQMKQLEKWNFKTPFYITKDELTIDYLDKLLIERKKKSEFDIDGIVIEDNSKKYIVKDENPKHAFAYKSLSILDTTNSEVEKVEWNVSMDGFLKPRIKIKPIEHSSGVTITYATAFNGKYIVDNNIGKGAIVSIVRSGDVIPYILEIVKPADKPDMPSVPYKWNETGVDLIVSTSLDTIDEVAVKKITYFFSTLGIKNISKGIVAKLVSEGYDDIFKILNADKDKLKKIDGLGEKSVNKIYNNIDNTIRKVDLATLMSGSRIFGRGLAKKKLEEVINMYPNLMKEEITLDEVLKVEGFAEKMGNKFVSNLNSFKKFYKKLNDLYDFKQKKEIKKGEKFKNEIIVMTGFRDKDLEEYITNNGGKVSNSVSSKTTLLICNDINDKSSKIEKAKELKIEIKTKKEFTEK